MILKSRFRQPILVALVLGLFCPWTAAGADSFPQEADALFQHIADSPQAEQEKQLQTMLEQYPGYPWALNNLGVIAENKGNLQQAAVYYQEAINSDPELPHPHAGLGDVFRIQGRHALAVHQYQTFLELAAQGENRKRYPALQAHFEDIRSRIAALEQDLQVSAGPLISADQITRGLTTMKYHEEGAYQEAPGSRIDIPILFGFDSDRISNRSYRQLNEIATALRMPELAGASIGIYGHTDSSGAADYNQELSRRRAQSVKKVLSSRFGIDSERLFAKGFGETRPVAGNVSEAGRAQNRRVELVNLGPAPQAQAAPEKKEEQSPSMEESEKESFEPEELLVVALLDFESLGGDSKNGALGRMVSENLATLAVVSTSFDIVERKKLKPLLDEQEIGHPGEFNAQLLDKIKEVTGADAVFTGSVFKLGEDLDINVRMIDIKTALTMAAANQSAQCRVDSVKKAVKDILEELRCQVYARPEE